MRRLYFLLSVGFLVMVGAPQRAEAQLGWVKRVLGFGKKPEQVQPSSTVTTSTAPRTGDSAAAGQADAAPGLTAPSPGVPVTSLADQNAAIAAAGAAEAQKELEVRLAYGRNTVDAEPRSLQSAQRRMEYWQMEKLRGPFNAEVMQRYEAAQRDYEELKVADSVTRARSTTQLDIEKRLSGAERALRANSFSDAESVAEEILEADPGNTSALRVLRLAKAGQKAQRIKYALVALGAALVALFAVLAVFSKKFSKKEEQGASAKGATTPGGTPGRKAYLQVVDGIQRGKLVQIQGDEFRIGAVGGDVEGERNDLVISDSLKAVSRFHCSILRKGRDYFLTDSSLNGTSINDRPMRRGDSQRLRDGDEFEIAAVARLKFVRT